MRYKIFLLLILCPYIQTVWASGECTITEERPTYDDTYGYCYTESVDNGVNCTIPQQTEKRLQKWVENIWATEAETSATITTLTFSYNNAISANESLGCSYNGAKFCVTYDNNGNAYQIGTQIINSTDDTTPDATTAFTPTKDYDVCYSSFKNDDGTCTQYGQQLKELPTTVPSPTCNKQGYVQDNTPQTGDFIYAKYFCMQDTCNEGYHFEADENNLTCFSTPIGKCVSNACKDVLPGCGTPPIKQATGNTTWDDETKQYNVSSCTCTLSKTENNTTTYQITYKWSQDTYDKNSPQGQWTEATRTITKCAQGYYKETNATQCTPVGLGYYSPSDNISRAECPIGSTTSNDTASSITSCHLTNDTKFCDQENHCETINFNTNEYPSHTDNKILIQNNTPPQRG